MGLSGSFALPVGRGSCRAVTLPCLIRVPSLATKAFLFAGARVLSYSFHAGFGGGFGVDALEGRSCVPGHILVVIG